MAIKESVLKDNIIHFILNVGLFITCMKPDIHLDMQLYICTLSKTVPHLTLKHLPQSSWKCALSHLLFWGTFWWHVTLDLPEISYSHTKKRKEKVEILKTNNKYKKIFIWLSFTLSKRQSPTTALFRTTLTRTITLYELLILLGSNHLLCNYVTCYCGQFSRRATGDPVIDCQS